MIRTRNKKTFIEKVERTDDEIIIDFMSKVLDISPETTKDKLFKEQKRLYSPYKCPDKISAQTVINCIPRKYKMRKTIESNPLSVNTIVNTHSEHRIVMLTRSSHGNQRFVHGVNGEFTDNVDSSRLFVDIYWLIKKPKTKKVE